MTLLRPALIALFLLSSYGWAQDVKYYEKAPSAEELQRQLMGGDAGGGKKKIRTRSIVFGDAPAPAEQPAQQNYQPQAAPQSYQQPAPQSVQVSEAAVAFPINFRVNSSEILPESVPFLESIAGFLQNNPGKQLLIEGHTDSTGSTARNTVLSRDRAFSVMNYLIDHLRIDPMRLRPIGRGSSEPLEGLPPTNPKNRRVQFRIIG